MLESRGFPSLPGKDARENPALPGKNGRVVYACLTMPAQCCRVPRGASSAGRRSMKSAMRVDARTIVNAGAGQGASRSESSGIRFTLPDLDAPARPAQSMAASALASLDVMMAVQNADEVKERRRRAAKRGHTLLNALESLKIALLSGQAGSARLAEIAASLKDERHAGADPGLDAVIGEIELRAAVELAKRGVK